jgi:DNA-binding NtrC family response regulator
MEKNAQALFKGRRVCLASIMGLFTGRGSPMSDVRESSSTSSAQLLAILVVDDQVLIRMAVSDLLRDEGFKVFEAASGKEGLIVLEGNEPVHLLISDIRMPGDIDGVQLSALAKTSQPGLPVILMSSHPTPGADQHADYFLAKPFPYSRLLAVVKECIGPSWKNTPVNRRNAS